MKINFGMPITDIKGEAIVENEKAVTLGSVSCQALLASYSDEQNLSGKEKVERFTLAALCSTETEADVSIEDVALLKKLIGKAYGPLVVGRAYEIIEPRSHGMREEA